MPLSEDIIKKISHKFAPSSTQWLRQGRHDVALIVDEDGNAVQLFIGKKDEQGKVIGERYTRTLVYDNSGAVVKDHWDQKGKSS